MSLCTVNRAFHDSDGILLSVGTKVDSECFPLAKQLISQRWLTPAAASLKRCLVTRAFEHVDRQLKFGDIVDASTWPNAEQMIEQRFIRVMSSDEAGTVLQMAPLAGQSVVAVSVPVETLPVAVKRGRGRPRKTLGGTK